MNHEMVRGRFLCDLDLTRQNSCPQELVSAKSTPMCSIVCPCGLLIEIYI